MSTRPYADSPIYDLYDLVHPESIATPEEKKAAQEELDLRKAEQAAMTQGKGGRSRRSRLNVKRRGTKRHGRSGKHRKLRKLTTRRR